MLETPGLTNAQSAELLRLALPMMSKHGDGFNPISYSIWFEYVRAANPELVQSVDQLIAQSGRLTGDQTMTVFETHVRATAEEAVMKTRTGLLTLLQNVKRIVVDLGSDSQGFGSKLKEFGESIASSDSIDVIQEQVDLMSQQVVGMRESMAGLSNELSNNQAEVSRLTNELQRLREDATTDALSGLMNRRGFDQEIRALKLAAEQSQTTFSIVMIDIDFFKKVNDTYGHLTGDRVIQGIAQLLKACTKGADSCARYGGEEFAVLLPTTSLAGAMAVAEQVRGTVERVRIRRTNSEDAVSKLTVSSGVAEFRTNESVEQFVQRADQALYRAKSTGRNRVCAEA